MSGLRVSGLRYARDLFAEDYPTRAHRRAATVEGAYYSGYLRAARAQRAEERLAAFLTTDRARAYLLGLRRGYRAGIQ